MYHRAQPQSSLPSRPAHASASYRSSAPNVNLLKTSVAASAAGGRPSPTTGTSTGLSSAPSPATTTATAVPSTSTSSASTSAHPLSNLPTARLLGHRAVVRSLAWNADGRRLASGSVDKSLRVWVPEKDLKTSVDYRGHVGEVSCVKWEPTHPERLATCSGLSECRMGEQSACTSIQIRTLKIFRGLHVDKRTISSCISEDKPTNSVDTDGSTIHLTWSPDGETIILSSRYDVVTWIDVKTHQIIKKKVMPTETNEPIFTHNGKILMTAIEGNLHIADFPSEDEIHQVRISPAMTTVLDLDPRGRYVAAGSNDNLVTLWETDEFCCVSSMGSHEDPIRACRFSHDGQYLATSAAASGSDDKIIISQIPSLSRAHLISTPQPVEALAWHPSKTIMAYAAGENGAIRIFGL
ncbi:BQ2448_1189 [Microbotryum intermedium]|uniref:BQ2448_1189 protein n=1 Tax=Microbotryum intermedium TaxID=269621 RepID=A0A238F9B3_9BASI|nr:BQ2448_1189 [Microbotryum intermedium]